MINQKQSKGKRILGSSLSLPAHGRAGARATPFLAAFFAERKTKFGGGKARGEAPSEAGNANFTNWLRG